MVFLWHLLIAVRGPAAMRRLLPEQGSHDADRALHDATCAAGEGFRVCAEPPCRDSERPDGLIAEFAGAPSLGHVGEEFRRTLDASARPAVMSDRTMRAAAV